MVDPPSRGPHLPKDQPKPGDRKVPTWQEMAKRTQFFLRSGWRLWLVKKRWPLAIMISLVVAALVSPHMSLISQPFEEGTYAQKAIKAPRDINIQDVEGTQKLVEEMAAKVWPVYDYEPYLMKELDKKIVQAFTEARKFFSPTAPSKDGSATGKLIPKSELDEAMSQFQKTLGVNLEKKTLLRLQRQEFSTTVQVHLRKFINRGMDKMIVQSKKFHIEEGSAPGVENKQGITIIDLDNDREFAVPDTDKIYELAEVEKTLQQMATEEGGSNGADLALDIAMTMIQPNLTFNKSETGSRREAAKKQVPPSVRVYKKNQLIVAEGDLITPKKYKELAQIFKINNRGSALVVFLSIAVFNFLFVTVLFQFAIRNISKFKLTARDILFLAFFICLTMVMVALGMAIAESLDNQFDALTVAVLVLALPVPAAAMTVRFLLNSEVAVIFAIVTSFLSSLIVEPSMTLVIFYFAASLVGAHFIARASQRHIIIKSGFYAGLFNILSILTLRIALSTETDVLDVQLLLAALFAFVGGVLSGLVVLSITPIMEWMFGYTSNITLLELASLNHPILKEMVLRAPGTYNHSTLVSSLAEGAAEAIGCNPLLAKVGALYHDIGKINKPEYFVENLAKEQDNKHDTLYPRMSGLILTSHVKEGVEMAKRHGLGDPIADIIQQHHGTSLIYYFYKRAKDREDGGVSRVDESDYRYSGPRPQTREAAIVMMADIVEASTRSLKNPIPTRVSQNVEDMIERVFRDGQLDECNLTLRDLQYIAMSFNRILNGVFHSRVEYPDQQKESTAVDDTAQRSTESVAGTGQSLGDPGKGDI